MKKGPDDVERMALRCGEAIELRSTAQVADGQTIEAQFSPLRFLGGVLYLCVFTLKVILYLSVMQVPSVD